MRYDYSQDTANEFLEKADQENVDLREQLAALLRERDEYRKGYEAIQTFAESLPIDMRVRYFIGGHDIVTSLIEYAKRQAAEHKRLEAGKAEG